MKVVVSILGGGIGLRFGKEQPKQFEKIKGKTILEHSVAAFENHPQVDEIVVVMHEDYIEFSKKLLNGFSKVKGVISGGKTRSMSSFAGISFFESCPDETKILIHDAARPFVSQTIITNVIKSLDRHNSVNVATAVSDTAILVDDSGKIKEIPERNLLKLVQTPQGFKLGTIKKAYKLAFENPDFTATDDCGIVFNYLKNEEIFIVEGEKENIKITTKSDLSKYV
ncbi:MAG: 2-C-methyl-D-erythritol 4-phosphate cytidylyltransferase [bacterium]